MRNFFLSAFIIASLQPAFAEDWRRWRGPNENGSSATANPPLEWSPTKNIRWKTEVPGKGSSTPIIVGDKVFVLTAIKTDREDDRDTPLNENEKKKGNFGTNPLETHYHQMTVLCYDRNSGNEVWRKVATEVVPHERGHSTNTFASSSPVTDGKRLFVSFGSYGIYCFDLNGNQLWTRELGRMRTRASFGEGASPALQGETLIVPWDHEEESSVVALDTQTGEVKWRTGRDEITTWATPLIVRHKDKYQVVMNGHTVRSYDLDSGSLIWECGGQVSNPIPNPIAYDGKVICMTGFRGNVIQSISLDATGDVTDNEEFIKWQRTDAAPYVPSATLYDGRLYLMKGTTNVLTSVDVETGEPVIKQSRITGIRSTYASLVAASDRIYVTGRKGVTVVIGHADELKVLATNDLAEPIDASPALVDDQIFIRGAQHLFCIERS